MSIGKPVKWVRIAPGHWESDIGEVYLVAGNEEAGEWEGCVKGDKILYIPRKKSAGEAKLEVERMHFAMRVDSAR